MVESRSNTGVRFKIWTEEEFATSAAAWQRLLENSNADRLFNSWDWQWRWWKHNAPLLEAELLLIAAYAADGELIGLAPFFMHRFRHKVLRVRRLELLGRAWRTGKAVFSEYLDIIVVPRHEREVVKGLARILWEHPGWGDIVMSNVRPDSVAARLAMEFEGRGAYLRTADPLSAYAAVLPPSFDQYVRRLSSGTRRRLWGHRARLTSPKVTEVAAPEIDRFLDVVDTFHKTRWGKPQYTGVLRGFHQDFAAEMANRGALRMTLLHSNGAILSAMYNVRLGETEYNLQQGFDVAYAAGLSPGYLHFGYCIEDACGQGLQTFDLLAGRGQHRQYKGDLLADPLTLVTFQAVRGSLLRPMYKWRDAARTTTIGVLFNTVQWVGLGYCACFV